MTITKTKMFAGIVLLCTMMLLLLQPTTSHAQQTITIPFPEGSTHTSSESDDIYTQVTIHDRYDNYVAIETLSRNMDDFSYVTNLLDLTTNEVVAQYEVDASYYYRNNTLFSSNGLHIGLQTMEWDSIGEELIKESPITNTISISDELTAQISTIIDTENFIVVYQEDTLTYVLRTSEKSAENDGSIHPESLPNNGYKAGTEAKIYVIDTSNSSELQIIGTSPKKDYLPYDTLVASGKSVTGELFIFLNWYTNTTALEIMKVNVSDPTEPVIVTRQRPWEYENYPLRYTPLKFLDTGVLYLTSDRSSSWLNNDVEDGSSYNNYPSWKTDYSESTVNTKVGDDFYTVSFNAEENNVTVKLSEETYTTYLPMASMTE